MARSASRSAARLAPPGPNDVDRNHAGNVRSAEPHKLHSISCSYGGADLETYLARAFALALLALALLSLLLSGALPVPNTPAADASPDSTYRAPALLTLTAYHVLTAVYAYSRWAVTSQTGYLLGLAGSGGLACFGGAAIMFSNEMAASKGSGWMFPTAAKRQRKADRREAREEKWENVKKAL